ncbi:hypothetical protein KSF73_05535 [Burkholderiaceae bacterium DAT-1]|nr:hypothetical protein [Burkholderiaceae bacterium DAT-1]
MILANHIRLRWWIGFLLSALLPLWLIALVLNFGGWIVEEIDYGLFKLFILLTFISALILSIKYLRKPNRLLPLRVFAGVVISITMVLGGLLTSASSSCGPQVMRLGKMWAKENKQYAALGDCSNVAFANELGL